MSEYERFAEYMWNADCKKVEIERRKRKSSCEQDKQKVGDKGCFVCDRIIRIVSESLDDRWTRHVIDFKGCGSLTNFLLHLKRTNSLDYDKAKIQNIIDECEAFHL